MQRSLSLNKAMLRQILILRLVSQKPRLKWWFCGYCVIPCNALYVIARSNATWQSPGRVTLLIIWWFLSNCQKDTLAIIYNRCVLININTSVYDMEIKSGWLWYIKKIDWSLQTNCIDILISSLLFDFNNDVLINSGVDQVRKLVKADKMAFIVLGFITRYPFRGIATLRSQWHKVRCTERVINCAFDQTIAVNDNCLSFACLFLCPTGTQYPAWVL